MLLRSGCGRRVGSGRTPVLLEPSGESLVFDPVVGTELGTAHGTGLESTNQCHAMFRSSTYPADAVDFDQARYRCRHRDAIYDDNDTSVTTPEEWRLGLRLPTHKHWCALTASTLGFTSLSLASGFGDEKYSYDASGNMVEKQLGDHVTCYDYVGNQLNGVDRDSGQKQYEYDTSGRLTGVSSGGVSRRRMEHQYLDKVTKVKIGDESTEFLYNSEGQLVGKKSSERMEILAWDGISLVYHNDKSYVTESGFQGGFPVLDSVANEVIVSDYLGNTLQMGTKSYKSTAFGEQLEEAWFTGKPYIKELESYVFKYRNYSPSQGRWHSTDPLGFPDGTNSFAYLRDPNTGVDPLGTKVEEISNTVATPAQGSSGNWGSPYAGSKWYASGSNIVNNGKGFIANLSHDSSSTDMPIPKVNKIEVLITADDDSELIFHTALSNIHQGSGGDGLMGLTAKMSPSGQSTISAHVTGGIALFPSNLDGVAGVTSSANAPGVTVAAAQGGFGLALTYGGGNWKWAEN